MREICEEVKTNFLLSSYDVNCNRAFPDARDGLKPGQRACLWDMYKHGYTSNKPHVKSAKISGSVVALWHPHSNVAVYETFARMSQPFTNNLPEVDFHGSNGNEILGPYPASERYTESRLAGIAEDGILAGVEKDTVDMQLNFSEDQYWPTVFPSVFPRLLVNGSKGIGVSLAQLHLPHNLLETIDVITKYVNTGEVDCDYTPDFPTGGTLVDITQVQKINKTGKGKVTLEAKYHIKGREVIFTELCYQTYVEPIIEQIKEKLETGAIFGVVGVDNKSDKDGVRLSITLSRSANQEEVIENILSQTDLRKSYSANQYAVVENGPKLLGLEQQLKIYVDHNLECIVREKKYDREKAAKRLQIILALLEARRHITEVIDIIKEQDNPKEYLMDKYLWDGEQVKAVLGMPISSLSNIDTKKLEKEREEKESTIIQCDKIIDSSKRQKAEFLKRLGHLGKKYGTPRKTQINPKETVVPKTKKKSKETKEVAIVFVPQGSYVQKYEVNRVPSSDYFTCKEDELILLFSSQNKYYRLGVKDIPFTQKGERGTAVRPLLNALDDERIIYARPNRCDSKEFPLLFAYENGKIKLVELQQFIGTRRNVRGIKVSPDETKVVELRAAKGNYCELRTALGFGLTFDLKDLPLFSLKRRAGKGINLREGDSLVGARIVDKTDQGKVQKPGGKGKAVRSD